MSLTIALCASDGKTNNIKHVVQVTNLNPQWEFGGVPRIRVEEALKEARKMSTRQDKHLLDRITINPHVMVGKPTIRGLRITVEQVLNALAAGITTKELLKDYPELEAEDIQAVLSYAAELVGEAQVFEVGTGV